MICFRRYDLADRKEFNLSMISSFNYCNGATLEGKSHKCTLINARKFYLSDKKLMVVEFSLNTSSDNYAIVIFFGNDIIFHFDRALSSEQSENH